MHFLGVRGGWAAQRGLWAWVNRGTLVIEEATPSMAPRMEWLMRQYRDRPMDLADASLVALAESRTISTIFTVDSDFRIYRLPNGGTFEVIP